MVKSGRCICGPANFLWLIIAVIVMGAGIWMIVNGFQAQWNNTASWQIVLAWYAVGLLVLGIGKMFKYKSFGDCPTHSGSCM